jgi:hypothetical protein
VIVVICCAHTNNSHILSNQEKHDRNHTKRSILIFFGEFGQLVRFFFIKAQGNEPVIFGLNLALEIEILPVIYNRRIS